MSESYTVIAHWDTEAQVWYSETDVPGLVVEAATAEQFESAAKVLAAEMLAENVGICDAAVSVEFVRPGTTS